MKTATGTECQASHEYNDKRDMGLWNVRTINGRRYTVCAHKVGEYGYCGALIDVTDLPRVVICCGDERAHRQD